MTRSPIAILALAVALAGCAATAPPPGPPPDPPGPGADPPALTGGQVTPDDGGPVMARPEGSFTWGPDGWTPDPAAEQETDDVL